MFWKKLVEIFHFHRKLQIIFKGCQFVGFITRLSFYINSCGNLICGKKNLKKNNWKSWQRTFILIEFKDSPIHKMLYVPSNQNQLRKCFKFQDHFCISFLILCKEIHWFIIFFVFFFIRLAAKWLHFLLCHHRINRVKKLVRWIEEN